MAATVAAQTRDFARRFFQVVLERGDDWVAASDAFERAAAAHPDHPYLAYIGAHRARKAGFAAAAEKVREREFPQVERRKAGTRRNAPVFYRVGRRDGGLQLDLPYEVPSSHPLRTARAAPAGNPLRHPPEPVARSPWRRRLSRRRSGDHPSSAPARASSGLWRQLARGALALLDAVKRGTSKRQR